MAKALGEFIKEGGITADTNSCVFNFKNKRQ